MKELIKKGTCMGIFENGEYTGCSCKMDKDRELEIGDVFIWNPWNKEGMGEKFKVIGFGDLIVGVEETK